MVERTERRRDRDLGFNFDDERIVEREIIYDGRGGPPGRRRGGW